MVGFSSLSFTACITVEAQQLTLSGPRNDLGTVTDEEIEAKLAAVGGDPGLDETQKTQLTEILQKAKDSLESTKTEIAQTKQYTSDISSAAEQKEQVEKADRRSGRR